jgi:hypothetical protein
MSRIRAVAAGSDPLLIGLLAVELSAGCERFATVVAETTRYRARRQQATLLAIDHFRRIPGPPPMPERENDDPRFVYAVDDAIGRADDPAAPT